MGFESKNFLGPNLQKNLSKIDLSWSLGSNNLALLANYIFHKYYWKLVWNDTVLPY